MVTKISSIQNSKTSSVEYTRMIPDWVAMKTKPPYLAHNQNGSLVRLSNLLSKLQHDPALSKEYDEKIEEQLLKGLSRKHLQLNKERVLHHTQACSEIIS